MKITILLLLAVMILTSCRSNENAPVENAETMAPGTIMLTEITEDTPDESSAQISDTAYFGGVIYTAYEDRITSTHAGETTVFAEVPVRLITADKNGVCILGGGKYREYAMDGTLTAEYDADIAAEFMCVTETYAVFAEPYDGGHKLIRLNRTTGEIADVPDVENSYGQRYVVKSLSAMEEDRILVLCWSDKDPVAARFGSLIRVLEAETGKRESSYLMENLPSCAAYNPADGYIYSVSYDAVPVRDQYYHTLYRHSGDSQEETAYIASMTTISKLIMNGREYFTYSAHTSEVITASVPELENTVRLLMDNAQVKSELQALVILLQSEYGINLVLKHLPADQFDEKVRLKLLAGDKDFDLMVIPDAGDLLTPVLNNHAYRSLDEFPEVTARFDEMYPFVRGMCTNEKYGDVFGMPFGWNLSKCVLAVNPEASDYIAVPDGAWTIEEFCDLAEKYAETRTDDDPYFCNTTLLTQLICSLTQALSDGTVTREYVEEMETRLHNLIGTGAVHDTNGSANRNAKLLLILWEIMWPSDGEREIDTYDRCALPSVNGKVYVQGGGWLVMNPNAANSENAAELLKILAQEEFSRNPSLPTCAYVYPDYSKYQHDEDVSDRMLEVYEYHGTLLKDAKPLTFEPDEFSRILHREGLWTECFSGMSAEEFTQTLWEDLQKRIYE
ncbi:MAG: carbohydrate ABC transporter substrate-binding protein [Clostridia bacterium]|nr:carbohydrate ABC transporter substrate-binding protein [Clostridia bacterium]